MTNPDAVVVTPAEGAFKGFLHDITPLPIVLTFGRILLRRKKFFDEIRTGNFSAKSRPGPYALTAVSLTFVAFALWGFDFTAPTWSSTASRLKDETRGRIENFIVARAESERGYDVESAMARLDGENPDAYFRELGEDPEAFFEELFDSHDLAQIALHVSAGGLLEEAIELHQARQQEKKANEWILFAAPFAFLALVLLQAISQHFFINKNKVRLSTTISIFSYFYASVLLCLGGVALAMHIVHLFRSLEDPNITYVLLVPLLCIPVLLIFFFRTIKQVMGAGYWRQALALWVLAPLAIGAAATAIILLILHFVPEFE